MTAYFIVGYQAFIIKKKEMGKGVRYVWVRTEMHTRFWLQRLKYKNTLCLK
jgi:hypothetical protein